MMRTLFLLVALAAAPLFGQSGGFLTGLVRERSGAPLPGASVRFQSEATGARQTFATEADGRYVTGELAAGLYKATVRSPGLRTIHQGGIVVLAGRTQAVDFVSDVLPVQQEMTVESGPPGVEDVHGDVLTVSRGSPQSRLPSNGRDLHALYSIMPGAVNTPASLGDGGQFTVGGQRPNANTFRVDGVSGNSGVGLVALAGSSPGATLPGMTTIGGTQSLVSKEETERVQLRSFDFSAEGGERPGALISVQTRPGSSDFHGSFFGYARPEFLDSPDPFARYGNYSSHARAASLHGWGGSLGGPLGHRHTFFFAALEKLVLEDLTLSLLAVPTQETRSRIAPAYDSFLQAVPLPSGRPLSGTTALGFNGIGKTANVSNYSFRVDRNIGKKANFFSRYANVPSSSSSFDAGVYSSKFGWMNATLGLSVSTARTSHEMRFNFSQAHTRSQHASGETLDSPGVEAVARALFNPSGDPGSFFVATPPFVGNVAVLTLGGLGQTISGQAGQTVQRQYEGAETVGLMRGRHTLRFGADFIALKPGQANGTTTLSVVAPSLDTLLQNRSLSLTSYNSYGGFYNTVYRASAFAQDTFRVHDRLSLEYGLRLDLTPPLPGSELDIFRGYQAVGLWQGIGATPTALSLQPKLLQSGSPEVWPMRYGQVAPRLGLAYRLKPLDLVLRLGAGLFFDPGLGSAVNPVNFNPLGAWQYSAPSSGLPSAYHRAPLPRATLSLPKVWEWRTSLEKSFGSGSSLSLSYLGSSGKHLLRREATLSPEDTLQSLQYTSHAASHYEAFLTQFRGNLTRSLYGLVSYTWAHSIDTASSDSSVFLVSPAYNDVRDRGSSSFDIRHVFSASMGYRIPNLATGRVTKALLSGWNVSGTLQARTGFPFDVTSADRRSGLGFDNTGRPDLVGEYSLWVADGSVAGGRRLNSQAFASVNGNLNGALGRNVFKGPGLLQVDTSLRRQFRLFRESALELSVSAFNPFNQRSYSNPNSYLGSPLFGQPTRTQSLMLGTGGPTTGLPPIYQAGGPRTVELGLRFQF